MATLDSLSRTELLKALETFEYYLGVADAAKTKIREVNSVITQKRNALKSEKKTRRFLLILLFALTASIPYFAGMIAIISVFRDNPGNESLDFIDYLFFFGGIAVVIIVLSIWFFAIRFYKKKNHEDQRKTEKYISGIYAYIPFYTEIFNNYTNKAEVFCQQYNIHRNFNYLDIVSYVRRQLTSYSTLSLQKAIQNYYDMVHKEQMLGELQKQNRSLTQIQEENREFYHNVLSEMERGNQIARETQESVDYIRYFK